MPRMKTGQIFLHFQGYTTILAATECCTECHMIYVR